MSTGKSQVASRGNSRVASSQLVNQRAAALSGEQSRGASASLKFPTPMSTLNAAKQEVISNNPGHYLNSYGSMEAPIINKSGYSLGSGSTNASLSGEFIFC